MVGSRHIITSVIANKVQGGSHFLQYCRLQVKGNTDPIGPGPVTALLIYLAYWHKMQKR